MRQLLLALLLVAMTGCGPDTEPEEQSAAPANEDQPTVPTVQPARSAKNAAQVEQPTAPAETASVNSIGMRFVPIPAGTFTMGEVNGSKREIKNKIPHQVTLTQAFELGVYEVTQEQYEAVMGTNPSNKKSPQNPVVRVSWDDAVEFCRKLSDLPAEKSAGYEYRLPTEAEWEYACRAATKTRYSFGDSESEPGDYAWCEINSGYTTHPVGGKKPNPWGLYDMHGNVWEWCQNWLGDYPSGAVADPTGPASGTYRALRGGSFQSRPAVVRSAHHVGARPGDRLFYNGFRPARTYNLFP